MECAGDFVFFLEVAIKVSLLGWLRLLSYMMI